LCLFPRLLQPATPKFEPKIFEISLIYPLPFIPSHQGRGDLGETMPCFDSELSETLDLFHDTATNLSKKIQERLYFLRMGTVFLNSLLLGKKYVFISSTYKNKSSVTPFRYDRILSYNR
jgi:hypothetical protein